MQGREKQIKMAYHSSKNYYDNALTGKGVWGKIYMGFLWKVDDWVIRNKLFSYLPDGFSGKLLDVPTGTGLFTADKYRAMNNAEIIALDYSEDIALSTTVPSPGGVKGRKPLPTGTRDSGSSMGKVSNLGSKPPVMTSESKSKLSGSTVSSISLFSSASTFVGVSVSAGNSVAYTGKQKTLMQNMSVRIVTTGLSHFTFIVFASLIHSPVGE